ncbi:MAG: GNAT family N-acetyltransferase [Thermoanaerobaculia bacterium]|nr:GNAT family N-acetyltransferase [Thermoanaerobaculia bacterium]
MTSYRFCRPDDIPLLVQAINDCYDVYFPDQPPMSLERFRAEMRQLDVWPSNCMVAISGHDPVAVLIGTKRDHEVLVHHIGVRPGYERQGHGSHMVSSLSQKLAVLGPPRLVAEVPHAIHGLDLFFESCDYSFETTFVDYWNPGLLGEPAPDELLVQVGVEELLDAEVLEVPEGVAWERQLATLRNRREELAGLAVVSPERIEAYCLYHAPSHGAEVEILAARCVGPSRHEVFLGLLLRHLAAEQSRPLSMPKASETELPPKLLAALGFEPGESYDRYTAEAIPA